MSKDIDDLIMQLVDNEQPEGGRSDDENAVDEYGPDLYKDEEDRRRLLALPEVERERILSERSEERQRNLERLEVRKLLNEGRREDTTRRSTRTKDSTTSRALSELTKRREEKSRSRSKRSAEQPAFEKRRKVASPTGESEEEYSEEEDVRDLEKTSERKEKKRHPTYEEIQSIWLPRELIGQWLYTPYFENTVIGSMVRIYIGKDNDGKDTYRACEVLDVVPYHKSYKISEKYWCDKALMLKHGEAEKTFTMDIISNSLFTHHEYERLIKQCEYDKAPVPSVQHVEEKAKDIERAKTYVLNEKEVTEMVEKKRLARGGQYYTNKDIAQLHVKLEYARSINDIAQINELTEKLNSIRRSGEKRLDDVSQSRRIQSLIQQRKLEQEQKEKKKLYQEPFQPPRYQPGSKIRKPKFMDFAKSLPFFM